MTRRKVTMLEAFQDSARTSQDRRDAALSRNEEAAGAPARAPGEPIAPSETRTPTPAPSVHDGPAIVPVGEASRGNKTEQPDPKGAAAKKVKKSADETGLALPFSGFGFAALQVLLLVGAFLLGRQFEQHGFGLMPGAGAEASDSGGLQAASFGAPGRAIASRQDRAGLEVTPSSEALAAAGGVDPQGAEVKDEVQEAMADPDTAFDRAFWDPAMRFTVLAINYSRNPANEALAWETYDLLMGLGFPVVKPQSRGMRIFLHVGAAASIDELADLRDQLQNLRVGPRQTPDFRTAYVVNINREGE